MKRLSFILLTILLQQILPAQELRFYEFGFRTPLPDSLNVIAATSDPNVIAKAFSQLAIPEPHVRSLFINGEIQYGTETNNPRYTWHFVTNAWDLVELAIELCDGRPDDVENAKQYWIETVGSFCPWSSYLVREILPSEVPDTERSPLCIYPNPTGRSIRIDAPAEFGALAITVLDLAGKRITTANVRAGESMDLSSVLHKGSYYILVRHKGGSEVQKVVLQ